MKRIVVRLVAALALGASWAQTPAESPNGVKTLDPSGAIKAIGTWSLGARAGDFVFVAGMQGVDPATNTWYRIRRRGLASKSVSDSEKQRRHCA